jgi:DNA-binding XRE family transcriptional regulator
MARPLKRPSGSEPNRIAELRWRARMSQTQLGAVLGITQTSLAKIERGEIELRMAHALALARFFGVPVSWLVRDPMTPAGWRPRARARQTCG